MISEMTILVSAEVVQAVAMFWLAAMFTFAYFKD